jgi:hypothetical protein
LVGAAKRGRNPSLRGFEDAMMTPTQKYAVCGGVRASIDHLDDVMNLQLVGVRLRTPETPF